MGNFECSCTREDYETAKTYSNEKYHVFSKKAASGYKSAKEYTITKTNEAKITYAP